jgi:uncharacterized protein YneF (UPF0154 family)
MDNLDGRRRKGKISPRCARKIIRSICSNPRITSKEILSNLDASGMKVSRQILQGTMRRIGLKGC